MISEQQTNIPDYLTSLNEQQLAAVMYTEGPSLVIAGAGSGKTRVLTYKIVHLLQLGFEPWRIMALTFTNKAAREMKERISSVVGERIASRLWMGTFHSVFLRILRAHSDLLGYRHDFTIYDASDSKALVTGIIKDLNLDSKVYKAGTIAGIISSAKNSLISVEQYLKDADFAKRDATMHRPMTGRIYKLYCERCRLAQAMDFDDILFYMNVLLRDHPDVLRHYQEYFRYILVDEYQDTNFAQHLIISRLSELTRNLCVVGDDAQSIYSFRGANIANILGLERHYPDLRIFKLERNYRSTQNIINAAGSLIKKNRNQIPKNVFSKNEEGERVKVISAYSDLDEAALVAGLISGTRLAQHDSFDQYAVLYRTNAQSRLLEESLRKRSIPYRIYGGLSFYQRKEVKDAICYFRMAINPDDDEALRRVINYPARGIGATTLKKVSTLAIEKGMSMWQVVSDPVGAGLDVNKGTANKLIGFANLIEDFIADNARGASADELAQLIYNRTGMLSSLMHDNTPEAISRSENLQELRNGIQEFIQTRLSLGEEDISMGAFLSEVSLATDQDTKDAADDDEPKVTLMTMHAAKGLEFKNIYIVGAEEELIPSSMCMDSLEEIEEERRLLYVAITRAKEHCTITYASQMRHRNGQPTFPRPSRFLREIDTRFVKLENSSAMGVEQTGVQAVNNYRQSYSRPQFFSSGAPLRSMPPSEPEQPRLRTNSRARVSAATPAVAKETAARAAQLAEGMRVNHARFGAGTILSIEGEGADTALTIEFDDFGQKRIILRFAKLDIK